MWKHVRRDESVDDRNPNEKVSLADYTAKRLFKTLLGECTRKKFNTLFFIEVKVRTIICYNSRTSVLNRGTFKTGSARRVALIHGGVQ